jgi:hypothetical protein
MSVHPFNPSWTDATDQVLWHWMNELQHASQSHALWAWRLRIAHRCFGMGQIILSAMASIFSVLEMNQIVETSALPVLNISATLMLTLGIFFMWNVSASLHTIVSHDYHELFKELELILCTERDQRGHAPALLQSLVHRIISIQHRAPMLPPDRWQAPEPEPEPEAGTTV